jgi:Tfp pilus assembly protein PilF
VTYLNEKLHQIEDNDKRQKARLNIAKRLGDEDYWQAYYQQLSKKG